MSEVNLNLENETTASDLVSWLAQSSTTDFVNYYIKLNSISWRQLEDIESLCLLILRRQRTDELIKIGCTNATQVLSEPELLHFITMLSLADLPGLQEIHKKHSILIFPTVKYDFSESLSIILIGWNNFFHFFTTHTYLEKNKYLHSILSLNLSNDQIFSLEKTINELVATLNYSYEVSNYEVGQLKTSQKELLKTVIKSFSFLPSFLINENSVELPFATYDLLCTLQKVLIVIRIIINAQVSFDDMVRCEEILWDYFAKDLEIKEISLRRSIKFVAPNNQQVDLFTFFDQIFNYSSLESGLGQKSLDQYVFQLTSIQKSNVRIALEDYLRTSPMIQTLFGSLDIDFFISTIHLLTKEEIDPFLANTQDRIVPDFWPITSKVMRMVANIY